MNILYIGPFQKNDELGFFSSTILKSLCDTEQHKVYAYPIYSGADDTELSNINYLRLNNISQYPDINIQHCSIETLYADINSKTYFIPIHNQDITIHKAYLNKLNAVDKIIVFDDWEYNKYIDIGIDSDKIFKCKCPATKNGLQHIDIGIYNTYKKYYFIGDYTRNKENIHTLINSFVSVSKDIDDICLLLCCDSTNAERKSIITYYEQTKKELKANNREDRILFLLDNISLDKINYIHNSCNYYFTINNTYYPAIDAFLANQNNNTIIGYSNLGYVDELDIGGHKKYHIGHKALKQAILDCYNNQVINNSKLQSYTLIDLI